MAIIPKDDVKSRFPLWNTYLQLKQSDDAALLESRLDQVITTAEGVILEYVPHLTSDNITEALKVHLMNLIRYHSFQLKMVGKDFENKPAVVKEYERTLARLEMYRTDQLDAPDDPNYDADEPADFRVNAKERRFKKWFTDPEAEPWD